jgi:hypothetical protein
MKTRWLICGVLLIIMLCTWAFLPPPVFLIGAFILFFIGYAEYEESGSPQSAAQTVQSASQAPAQSGAATAQVILPEREMPENIPADLKCPSCGASIKPTDRQCNYCNSNLQPLLELPTPAKLAALEIGKTVRVIHPQKGEQTYQVRGRLLYTELWQATRGASVPWTPTGNYYAGFALEPEAYLLNWQERFYLLETRRPLTDMDINRDFMPYAKQFAQSNQTARVQYSYDNAYWRIVDIGRFAIEFEEGEGLHLRKGAIGRFIHSGSDRQDDKQALVLDDFQSGGSGGQDTLWRGWQIDENEIKF